MTINDSWQHDPDPDVDVAREQQPLAAHPVVAMQHPFYRCGTPAMIQAREDLVLEHGRACGRGGTALQGETLLTTTTAGGSEQAYRRTGRDCYPVRELLAPIAARHVCARSDRGSTMSVSVEG